MPLPATLQWDVRQSGSDNNGGAWDSASAGTDFSQQNSPQVVLNNSSIITSITANVITFTSGYSPTNADLGNVVWMTGGTNVTVGAYCITAVTPGAGGTWTVTGAVALPTSGTTTNATGNMGGSKASIGGVGLGVPVAGNYVWIKYNISPYGITQSANASGGRYTNANGTQALPVMLRGFDVAHGDQTGNRPTLQWSVAGASQFIINVTGVHTLENLILDGNSPTFSATGGVTTSAAMAVRNCQLKNCSNNALRSTGAGTSALVKMLGCEVTGCNTAAACNLSGTGVLVLDGCSIHDNTFDGVTMGNTGVVMANRTLFATNKSAATRSHIVCTTTGIVSCNGCTFYNSGSHQVDLQAATMASFANCIFETSGGYGVATDAAGVQPDVQMLNCAFYNNSTGKYDGTKIFGAAAFGEINQSAGSYFVTPGTNFAPNTTAGQGALIRATGFPSSYPGFASTLSYGDVGAVQHQDTGGGGGSVMLLDMSGGVRG